MASQGQMIVKMPNGHVEVKARRRLKEPETFQGFVEEIQTTLTQLKESNSDVTISDFDVSQNPLTAEQFEQLFGALTYAGVKVLRFRLFGCPALNDEAMQHLASFLTSACSSETSPTEMHLSDCAITTEGFNWLMSAVEDHELYPTSILKGRQIPLYLRLENNYIDETVIQEKVDAGIIRPFKKAPGVRQEVSDPSVKINLVVREDNKKYQQKTGEPPAPEDAPPPKEVYDHHNPNPNNNQWKANNGAGNNQWRQGNQGWQGNQNWQQGNQNWQQQQARPQWNNNAAHWWRPQAAAQALPAWQGQQQQANVVPAVRPVGVVRPQYNAPNQGNVIRPRVATAGAAAAGARPAGGSWLQQGGGGGWNQGQGGGWAARGNAGTGVDRSRTPAGRVNNGSGGPNPPTVPPPKKTGGLPPNWEEQWSDEYQIPYFWNSETGESLWEKPTA